MRVSSILSLMALLCLSGCALQSHTPIENDYSYQAEFDKYKTYALFTDLSARYPLTIDTKRIEKNISHRMLLLGYVLDEQNPDIMVAYSIHRNKVTLPGFIQPSINSWMKDQESELEYNEKAYKIRNGTLLIQIIDFKTSKCVWNGYITDGYRQEIFSDSRKLNLAVSQVLDQYRVFANGFIDKNQYLTKE